MYSMYIRDKDNKLTLVNEIELLVGHPSEAAQQATGLGEQSAYRSI